MKTWLPSDTREALRSPSPFHPSEPAKCDCRSLLLTRMPCSATNKDDSADARKDSLVRALKHPASQIAVNQFRWLLKLARSQTFSLWTDQRVVLGLANGVL